MCEPSELDAAIDACLVGGVLVASGGTYAFRHELARLAVESQIADVARRQLHRRAVDALQRRPGVDPARLAHHASEARDERALARASLAACLLAASRTAHREAVLHGELALALRRELTADDVAELQLRLAPSLVASARGDEAVRLVGEAVEHWRSRADDRREAEALVLLSSGVASLGRTEEAAAPLERAVSLLERRPPGPELALAYLRLTSAHMLARDRDTAVVWGERAIHLAAELDDKALLGRALIETGIADVMDARFDGLRRVREGIAVGRRHDLPGVVALGLSQIGSGCGEMRRYDEAVPALVEATAYAASQHLEQLRLYMVAWLGRCRFDLGQWDDAEALCREAIGAPRAAAIARFVGLNTLGWLRTTSAATATCGRCSTRPSRSPRRWRTSNACGRSPPPAPRRRGWRMPSTSRYRCWRTCWRWRCAADTASPAGQLGLWLARSGHARRATARVRGVLRPLDHRRPPGGRSAAA